MSSAEFSIDADPFSNAGYDATLAATVPLALEAAPGLDIRQVVFEVITKSSGSPDIVELGAIGGGGASPAPTVLDDLDVTWPAAGIHAYLIRATINDGQRVNAQGVVEIVPEWTKERLVAIRSPAGMRKIAPAESTQYSGSGGWTDSFNEMVELAAAGVAGVAGPGPAVVDNAVVRMDGVGGYTIQSSLVTLNNNGTLSMPNAQSLLGRNVGGLSDIPMIATDAGDNLNIGGNNAALAGNLNLDVPAGGTIVSKINGNPILTVAATKLTIAQIVDYGRFAALGGGAAPTLGTIGGTGPTAPGQSKWLSIEIGGVAHWVPAWV